MNDLYLEEHAADFKNLLQKKLQKYGFIIKYNSNDALYIIHIDNFQCIEEQYKTMRVPRDCFGGTYALTREKSSLNVSLLSDQGEIIRRWNYSNTVHEQLEVDEVRENCKTYIIVEESLSSLVFFRERALTIAQDVMNIATYD